MKRPSFQFYPADWRNNAKLRRCSEAARGAWMDILCVLHDGDEYGTCRWPLEDVARAAGVALKHARELVQKLVLKGADVGSVTYTHMRSHAGKDEPVLLLDTTGPCWFSSRMLVDEWRRSSRGGDTRFAPDKQPDKQPTRAVGDGSGDGPTSSSTSSPTVERISLAPSSLEPEIPTFLVREKQKEPDRFPEFYITYPLHKSRGNAEKAWKSALKLATADQIIAGAKRYALERSGQEAKFTAYPASWLRDKGWMDEVPSTNGAGASLSDLQAQKAKAERLGIPTAKLDRAIQELSGVAA